MVEKRFCLVKLATIFLFILLTLSSLYSNPEIQLRIAASNIKISLAGNLIVTGSNGKALFQLRRIEIVPGPFGIIINGRSSGESIIKILSSNLIEAGSRKFRKKIEIRQVDGKLSMYHALPMESYIAGVVASELPGLWPIETLKAQAIAARTYAVWQKYKKEHLETTALDQVYYGTQNEHPLAQQATQETAGLILTYESKPAHAYFHSSCGGNIASASEVFGTHEPYLRNNKCPYCYGSPPYFWNYKFSKREFDRKLGSKIAEFKLVNRTKSSRMRDFAFSSYPLLKKTRTMYIRSKLGYDKLCSSLITKCTANWYSVEFSGRGYGHGVGMCQWGAREMAILGKESIEILNFYYPNTLIKRFY